MNASLNVVFSDAFTERYRRDGMVGVRVPYLNPAVWRYAIEDGVPKPVISGGEQDIANLCLRLAISQMIAERAGQSFSLLILDEVFGSLDEARRQNVVELLRGLQDRFEQVILITHIEQVREGLDRVINVRYDEESGMSVVTQSDPTGVDDTSLLAGAGAED